MKKLGIFLGAVLLGLAVWKGGDLTRPADIWAWPYTAGQNINTNQNIKGSAWLRKVLTFEGSTTDTWVTNLQVVDPTQTNTITIPNASGTLIFGNGTAGKMTKWTGPASIGDASNTETEVASAVSLKHTQGTDQGLDTGGANEVTVANAKDAVTKKHAHTGTENYIPKWNGTAYVDGTMFDSGGNVGIGIIPTTKFQIQTTAITGREYLFKATVSDAGNDAAFISNGTSVNGRFLPSFSGYVENDTGNYSVNFRGMVSATGDAADSSSKGIINLEMFRTDSATDPNNGTTSDIVNRKLFTIYNRNTNVFMIDVNGNVGIGNPASSSRLTIKLSDAFGADSVVIQRTSGANTITMDSNGSIKLLTAGGGLFLKEGSNATIGDTDLVSGTKTISTNKVTANSRIFLTTQSTGGVTPGHHWINTRTAGTSFVIKSSVATDTSNVAWILVEPD